MATRIITGIIIAIVGISIMALVPDWGGIPLMALCAAGGAWEYLGMAATTSNKPLSISTALMAGMLPAVAGFWPQYLVYMIPLAIIIPFSIALFQPARMSRAFTDVSTAFSAILYVGGLLTFAALLAGSKWSFPGMLHLLAVSWLSDTTAFFSGKFLGRHKMYEAVSPKKTWEGAVGGLLGAVGGSFLIYALFETPFFWPQVVAVGVLAGAAEQIGDLCESLVKRSSGVKDSGSLLPGHGGVLDRVDGLMFAAPFVYLAYSIDWSSL